MKIKYSKEKMFARLLRQQKRKFTYQVPIFRLKNSYYRPDFYLPKENLYIEVVGSRQAYHANKAKYEEFKKLYPDIKFIIVDYLNFPYPSSKPYQHKNHTQALIIINCPQCGKQSISTHIDGMSICKSCKHKDTVDKFIKQNPNYDGKPHRRAAEEVER